MIFPQRAKVALTCTVIAASAPVRAQDATAEARAAFQQGVQQYAERRYAEALESFRRAYRVRPHPTVLVNIANCYVALNQPHQAVAMFERFLGDPTATATPAQRTEIETALRDARRQLAVINVLAQPIGAEIYMDGDLMGTAPLRRAIQTGPGPHVLEARVAGGGAVQYQARLEPGGALTVTLDVTRQQTYVGSVPPGASETAAASITTPPPATVTPTTPATVEPSPPPTATSVAPVVPQTPPPNRGTVAVTPPVRAAVEDDPSVRPVETVTVRARGYTVALVAGSVIAVGGLGAGLGFRLYANSLINDYNTLASLYRVEVAARGAQTREATALRQQGQNHASAIDQNVTLSTAFTVVGALGAAFTLGAAPFWPRTRVPATLVHVMPSLDGRGVTVGGVF